MTKLDEFKTLPNGLKVRVCHCGVTCLKFDVDDFEDFDGCEGDLIVREEYEGYYDHWCEKHDPEK